MMTLEILCRPSLVTRVLVSPVEEKVGARGLWREVLVERSRQGRGARGRRRSSPRLIAILMAGPG